MEPASKSRTRGPGGGGEGAAGVPSLPPIPSHESRGRHGAGSLPGPVLTLRGTPGGPHTHAYPTDLFSPVHFAFPWFREEGTNGAGTGGEEPASGLEWR